jgi:hypothetical protein
LIENHLAIVIACAPAIKSIFLNNVVLKVKTLLRSISSRTSLIWKRTPRSTTVGDRNSLRAWASPSRTSTSTKFRKKFSDIFSISTSKSNETTSNTVQGAEGAIELGFHEKSGDFIKDRTTLASRAKNPEEAPASKPTTHVSRNIDIAEEHATSLEAAVPAATNEENVDRIEEHNLEQQA